MRARQLGRRNERGRERFEARAPGPQRLQVCPFSSPDSTNAMPSKLQTKRKAPAISKTNSKKAKTAPSPLPAFVSDHEELDFGDDGDSDNGSSAGDSDAAQARRAGIGRAEEEDEEDFDEEDSEVNEFELGEEGEADDLIGDDDEDLMAGLDSQNDEEEEDDEDDEEDDDAAPPPPAIKKANVRNSKAPAPLKPAELRALAFAELTASPISNIIATQVSILLTPLTPPAPATSPLQPLLRSLHAHTTTLPAQKTSSLAGLRKRGVVVPKVEGSDGKWGKQDLEWEKPSAEDVRIVGRWAWGGSTKVKGEYVVDIAVAMPAVSPSSFQKPSSANDSLSAEPPTTQRLPLSSLPRQIDSLPRHPRISPPLLPRCPCPLLRSTPRLARLGSRDPRRRPQSGRQGRPR